MPLVLGVIFALLAALVAGAPPAAAGGVKIIIGGGTFAHGSTHSGALPHGHFKSVLPHRHVHPHTPVFVVPQPVYVACYLPGYWAYQWIPQSYTYNVWMPGAWSPDGTWIDGHYQPRVYTTGYYQPYWVDRRPC